MGVVATTVQQCVIELGSWHVSVEGTDQYLEAIGDELTLYREAGIAPPLALAAQVVGLLLERLSLPPGAIHSLQDLQTVRTTSIGSRVSATAEVETPRERGGMRFLTVHFTVADAAAHDPVLHGRTTVLLPEEPSVGGE